MPTLEETFAMIGPPDAGAMECAREWQSRLTKPPDSLALLEAVAVRIAGMRGDPVPALRSAVVIVVAGDHGVVAQAVTAQLMAKFIAGGAAICVLARESGAKLVLVDAGIAGVVPGDGSGYLDRRGGAGTGDISQGAAMTRAQARTLVEAGIALAEAEVGAGADVLLPGDMGGPWRGGGTANRGMRARRGRVTGESGGVAWQRKVFRGWPSCEKGVPLCVASFPLWPCSAFYRASLRRRHRRRRRRRP